MKIVVLGRDGKVLDTYYDVEPEDAESLMQWIEIKSWLKRTIRKGERNEQTRLDTKLNS